MTTTEKAMAFTSQKDLIQHEKDAHGIYCKISKEPEPDLDPDPISEPEPELISEPDPKTDSPVMIINKLCIHTDELNRTHMFYYIDNWMIYITPTAAYIGCPKDVYDKSCKYAPFAISCDYLPPPIRENTDQNIIKLTNSISSWMGWCHGDMFTVMNLKKPDSTWIMSTIDAYVLMREHENDNSDDDY